MSTVTRSSELAFIHHLRDAPGRPIIARFEYIRSMEQMLLSTQEEVARLNREIVRSSSRLSETIEAHWSEDEIAEAREACREDMLRVVGRGVS